MIINKSHRLTQQQTSLKDELDKQVDSGSLNQQIEAAGKKQTLLNDHLKELKEAVQTNQDDLDNLNQTIQDEQINLNNAKYELTNAQQSAAKNSQELDHDLTTLREDYQIEQLDLKNPDWNWDEKRLPARLKC